MTLRGSLYILVWKGRVHVLVRVKLIAMAMLVGISIFIAFAAGQPWHWIVVLALAFSWCGDALLARWPPLAQNVSDPFVAGMGMFALAQISYVTAFALSIAKMPQLRSALPGQYVGAQIWGALLPVYVLAGVLFWALAVMRSNQPGDLKGATLVYAVLLSAMAGLAASAAFTGTTVSWMLIVGGLLFMVSDGCIAAHLFQGRLQNNRTYEIAVWGTYFPAQLLLLLGTAGLY